MDGTSEENALLKDILIELRRQNNEGTSSKGGSRRYYDYNDGNDLAEQNDRLRKEIADHKNLYTEYMSDLNGTKRYIDSLTKTTKAAADNFKKASDEYAEAQEKFQNQLKKYGKDRYKKELEEYNKTKGDKEKENAFIESHKEFIDLLNEETRLKEQSNNLEKDENKYLESQLKLRKESISAIKEGFRDIKQGFSQIHGVAKDFMGVWAKADKAASDFAKHIGTSAAGMKALRANSIQAVAQGRLGAKYNVSADELLGIQTNYSKAIGRNALISSSDQEYMAAMQRTLGEEGTELAAAFENFGLSYTNAAERAGKMFQTASKYGISYDKYVQNVQQGLKIAQSYTFSNGLKSMQEMAKKATAIKLDMQQITAFANKVNTVQGAIETGARLQTLGGPFAQMGDPLGMLSDSINGVEGLLDRFTKMTGGLGRFNSNTGEMEVSAFNKRRLQAAAEAMGMDYGQVMESVQAQGRRNYVGNILKGRGNTNQEDIDFLSNAATIENGQANVSFVDKSGNKQTVNLNKRDLTTEELKLVKEQNQEQSEDIRDIAIKLRSWDDVKEGLSKQYNNNKALWFEKFKIGENVKGITALIGAANMLLTGILIGVTGIAVAGGVGGIRKGVGKMNAGWKGLRGGSISGGANTVGGTGTATGNAVSLLSPIKGIKGLAKETISLGKVAGGAYGRVGGAVQVGKEAFKGAGKLGKFAKSNAITGAILSGVFTGIDEFTNDKNKNHSTGRKIRRTAGSAIGGGAGGWGGAALGAAIGTAIAPGIGTIIGGLIGGAAGAFGGEALGKTVLGGNDKRRNRFKEKLGLSELTGDYTVSELKRIASGNINDKLQDKIDLNSDTEVVKAKREEVDVQKVNKLSASALYIDGERIGGREQAANGGLLNGPSHANGGMPIVGSNIEVEGGEFVVNKRSAAKYMGLLNTINTMSNGGIIRPRRMETGGALTVSPNSNTSRMDAVNVGVKDINLNINGSIKLEGNKGQNVDITNELLKDPQFIRKITRMIEEQMGINKTGGRLVNKGLY